MCDGLIGYITTHWLFQCSRLENMPSADSERSSGDLVLNLRIIVTLLVTFSSSMYTIVIGLVNFQGVFVNYRELSRKN